MTDDSLPLGWKLNMWYMLASMVFFFSMLASLMTLNLWFALGTPIAIVMIIITVPFLETEVKEEK